MDKDRENIIKQINSQSIEDIMNTPKLSKKVRFKEILKEFLLSPIRFFGAFLGVTEENIGSSSRISNNVGCGCNNARTHSEENTFKNSVSFDPSKAYMERIQEQAYFSLIDGKGDTRPCDCDHDR